MLTPRYAALVLARARIMDEGVSQTSARVDPTWYGRLIVPLTNNTKTHITLRRGEPFCTLAFIELAEPISKEQFLSRKNVFFLGQMTLEYEPRHAVYWRPAKAETVTLSDLDHAVDLFGPPFDVVRGAIYRVKEDIIKWMEERWAPSALRDIKNSIWEGEIEALKKGREEQRRTNYAIIATLVVSVLGWLVAICLLFIALFRGK